MIMIDILDNIIEFIDHNIMKSELISLLIALIFYPKKTFYYIYLPFESIDSSFLLVYSLI